jgi:hypothetical protein
MAAVTMAEPIPKAKAQPQPQPQPAAQPDPGYFNSYGKYVPTNADFANPNSKYYNPALVQPFNANPYVPEYDPFYGYPGAYPGAPAYSPYAYSRYYWKDSSFVTILFIYYVSVSVNKLC